jgi:hypothetical protein
VTPGSLTSGMAQFICKRLQIDDCGYAFSDDDLNKVLLTSVLHLEERHPEFLLRHLRETGYAHFYDIFDKVIDR